LRSSRTRSWFIRKRAYSKSDGPKGRSSNTVRCEERERDQHPHRLRAFTARTCDCPHVQIQYFANQEHHRRLQQLRVLQDELPDHGRDLRRIPVPRDQRGEVEPRPDQVAPRDRRGDIPEVADDDDPARDPAAQVVDVVVVVGAPLAEDGAEQDLARDLGEVDRPARGRSAGRDQRYHGGRPRR